MSYFSSMKRAITIFSSKKKRDAKSIVGYDLTPMERLNMSEHVVTYNPLKLLMDENHVTFLVDG